MEVPAVFRDKTMHCVIRVDITTAHTYYIENNGTEYTISRMRTDEFKRTFDILEGYDTKRAATKFLNNPHILPTSAARVQLTSLTENTMSNPTTFRAPQTSAPVKKAEPTTPKQAKAELLEKVAELKTKSTAKATPKTAPVAQKAPKVEAKATKVDPKVSKEKVTTPAPKKAEPKATEEPKRGRRGAFSDPDSIVKLVKRPTEGKKRALMIAEILETGENRSMKVSQLLKKITKALETLGQRDPAEAVLSVHGGYLLGEGNLSVK